MSRGIWVSPTKFVDFSEIDRSSLQQELASRSAAWDFSGLVGLLPDPDPILRKRGDGVEVLEELTGDGHLISAMQQRRLGVLKKEFKFEAGTDESGKTTSQSEQLCQDFNRDFNALKPRELLSSILNAPFYGMTPVELTFTPGDSRLILTKAEAKPVRWFGFNEQNELRFRSLEEQEDGEKVPWGKVVLARHFPEYDNPYGLRLLSRCFWPITFKKGGLKFWVSFMEKYGMPFLLGHYAKGTAPDEQEAMLGKLVKMVRDAVAVVPEGDKVEMLGGAGKTGGGYMIFDKMKSAMDAEVSKVITGQTLTTEAGDKGSYSLGKVHGDVLTVFQESDRMLAKDTLDEIATIYAKVNSEDVPPPVCTFFEKEDAKKEIAERDKILEESRRVQFNKSYYIRTFGYQEDDFEIVDQATGGGDPVDHAAPKVPKNKKNVDPYSSENQIKEAEGAQDKLDLQVRDYIGDAADLFGVFKKDIRSWLKGFETLQEAIDAIPELLTQLDTDELQSSLMAALLVADRLGTESVPTTQDHAEAVWGTGKPFKEALDFFKAKSLTVAGHTRADLVAGVKDALIKRMEQGGDLKSFTNEIDSLFITRGLDPLASHHIETLYRTNMQTAFQAGRYQQLTKSHILKARPYWRYVSVRDGVTRPAHKEMHGKVFHHTNAIWGIWYPPNGFNCRCQVVSVSGREVERDGLEVIKEDLSGKPFEVVDKETGEVKTFILSPDDAWGADGGKLERLLKDQNKKGGGTKLWKEKKGQPGPAELGRPTKGKVKESDWLSVSRALSLESIMDSENIGSREALASIEASYRKEMGIAPLESQAVIRSKDGSAITVTLQALAHAMVKRQDSRERFIPYLRHVLEDPYEILLTEYVTDTGKTKFRKKYIGLFKGEKKEGLVIVAEILQNGSVMWNIINAKKANLDRQRKGVQLVYGK